MAYAHSCFRNQDRTLKWFTVAREEFHYIHMLDDVRPVQVQSKHEMSKTRSYKDRGLSVFLPFFREMYEPYVKVTSKRRK